MPCRGIKALARPAVTGRAGVREKARQAGPSRRPPGPWTGFGAEVTYRSKTRGRRAAGETLAAASVMPQAEEAHAGRGLLHRDRDEVGGDVGDKDVLDEAARGLPVLAGLHGH